MAASDAILSVSQRETFWRTLQAFNATRVVIALVLLLYLHFNTRVGYWTFDRFLYLEICVAYFALSMLGLALSSIWRKRFRWQVVAGVALDVAVLSTFYVAAGGVRSGLAILFLFPLAGGAILLPLMPALFLASVVSLLMLGESLWEIVLLGLDSSLSQAGLYGGAYFVAVLALRGLSDRLLRQETLVMERQQDLRAQREVNRVVMADSSEGVLVLDGEGRVTQANPAALRLLGLESDAVEAAPLLHELEGALGIGKAWASWQAGTGDSPAYLHLRASAATVHLQLRFVHAREEVARSGMGRSVVFLEDVGQIENRAQQLKLVAMGRLTASIAHEVRNPLSAIAYAGSLMEEESLEPAQKRLARIICENASRLDRMVEDILKLARRAQIPDQPLALAPILADMIAELESTGALPEGMVSIGALPPQAVSFDPLHLREVVCNLLSNAARYASGMPGSVRLSGGMRDGVPELQVEDDGPGITAEVRAHLFEPFYTTSSKGTGLGLYLARELCLNNASSLDYEYWGDAVRLGKRGNGRFVLRFPANAPPLNESIALEPAA